jgi:hypothetical protein
MIPVTGNFTPEVKVLAITGMLAPPDEMERLPVVVGPTYGGLVAHLPGHSAPHLSETSLAAFASAFDQVAEAVGASVVLGMSVGALVALSMRSPSIKTVVAAEPPLETAKVWQLIPIMRQTMGDHAEFYREVIGFDGQTLFGRSYLHLLDDLPYPTAFIVGGRLPFPVRESPNFLSTVDEAQRKLIARSKNASLHVGENAGHAVHRHAAPLLQRVLLEACAAAAALRDVPSNVGCPST